MTAIPANLFGLQKLERIPLSEQAVQALLRFIEATKLPPGAPLPSEARLAEILAVSRPVVREALRTLKGLGVVEIVNGKRPAVRRDLDGTALGIYFSRAMQVLENSTEDLMDVRASLEGRAAALAAQRRGADDIDRMVNLVSLMQAQLHRPAAYAALDTELHLAIGRASGNLLIWQMIGSIRASLEQQSRLGMEKRRTEESLQQVQDSHAALVDRIVAGDAPGAADCMRQHMESALRVLKSDIGDDLLPDLNFPEAISR